LPQTGSQYNSFHSTLVFDGITTVATALLVKSTYFGDTTLSGTVPATEVTLSGGTNWAAGDFNYDGLVNGTDTALFNNAKNKGPAR
jgi:hypothetical protein